MKKNQNFTQGPILSQLVFFAIPVLFAIFLQTTYGAVDLLIVGQFSNPAQVSAVSTGSWIMQTITIAITGLTMGTTILLGKKIGENKTHEAKIVIGSSIFLLSILGIFITILTYIFAPIISSIMQAPKESFKDTVNYIRICSLGTIFIIAYNVLGSIFRGLGNSKLPLLSVAIACVFNILGDILLVSKFGLGSNGAAIATVFSQAVSVFICILIIKKYNFLFDFQIKDIKFNKVFIIEIIKLGIPIALQDVLVCISFLAITAIVNSLGVIISAGVGVAEKICGFVLIVPSAYMQSMSAFVAQNMGAKKPHRAKKALFYSISTSLFVGVFLSYFSFFHGELMTSLFAKDSGVILAAAEYLKAYAIDCMLVSFLFCFIGYFNGCEKTKFVMIQGIIGAFLVRIPVSYLMSQIRPVSLFKIGLATPSSTLIQIILCLIYFFFYHKQTNIDSFPKAS